MTTPDLPVPNQVRLTLRLATALALAALVAGCGGDPDGPDSSDGPDGAPVGAGTTQGVEA